MQGRDSLKRGVKQELRYFLVIPTLIPILNPILMVVLTVFRDLNILYLGVDPPGTHPVKDNRYHTL